AGARRRNRRGVQRGAPPRAVHMAAHQGYEGGEGNEGAENEGAQNEGAQNEGAGARPERGSRDRHGVPAARRARQEPRAAAGFSRAAFEGGAARGRGALSAGGGAAPGVALPSRRSIGDRALRS